MHLFQFVAFFALLQSVTTTIATASPDNNKKQCKRTKVAVLGAGVAGITAAQALNNASVTDFVIIEYQDRIGGRVQSSKFGKGAHGPYTVELGANWVQGIGVEGGPINPIWTLVSL